MPREAFTHRLDEIVGQYETPVVQYLRDGAEAIAKEHARVAAGFMNNAYRTALAEGATAPLRVIEELMVKADKILRDASYAAEVVTILDAELRTRGTISSFTPPLTPHADE